MEVTNYCFLVVFLLHYEVFSYVSSDISPTVCSPGLETTAGYTLPKGDIVLEYGSPLDIFCILRRDKTNVNSSSLTFRKNNESIPPEFIKVLNETTIHLRIDEPVPSQLWYYCEYKNGTGICVNYVSVGYKPSAVKDFNCVFFNWEIVNCSWTPPINYVKTTYELSFQIKKTTRNYYRCPQDAGNNYCYWDDSTRPPYRQPHDHYYFNLTGSNVFGNFTKVYTYKHFESIIPHKPINLSLVEATSNSLTITWTIPLSLKYFPPGLIHKVKYQSKWDPTDYWQVVDTSDLPSKNETLVYTITNLKYAHTLYDIRVMLKPPRAEDDKWSEPATTTLRTKATVPGQPPKTDIGSFETRANSEQHREVYLYWQQIPRPLENGDSLEYKIIHIEEFVDNQSFTRNITPVEVTKTFAKLKGLSFNRYRFTIVSSNKEGYSKNVSYISVPSKNQSPPEPGSFSKIAFDSGVYELSWNLAPGIDSYTLFWCDNKQDRPFDCRGYMNWTKVFVNKDSKKCDNKPECTLLQQNITLPVDKVYQFALSANTKTSSSGMVWASCTVLPDEVRGKLKNIWINRIGDRFMEVSWKLDCFDRSRIILGFQVTYCPLQDPQDSRCKEPEQNITIHGGPDKSSVNITSLKPYTTYKVYIAVVSEKSVGVVSDALFNTTMEAAPEMPPVNVTIVNKTNTSVTLAWKPPPIPNGVVRNYQVQWKKSYSTKIESTKALTKALNYTVTNLDSYEKYYISVAACTVECSPNFSTSVQTEIGQPGRISYLVVNYVNETESELNVTWTKPSQPAGLLNFYEVRLTITQEDKILSIEIQNTTDMSITIPFSYCVKAGPPLYYAVSVRAVNIARNNISKLYGPWSSEAGGNCYRFNSGPTVQTVIFMLAVGVLALIAVCIAFGYVIRWIWIQCKAMQNVGVKLPPQLELNNVFKDKSVVDISTVNHHICPQKPLDISEISPPDQEKLENAQSGETLFRTNIKDGINDTQKVYINSHSIHPQHHNTNVKCGLTYTLLLEKKNKEDLIESSIEDCEDGNVDGESGCGSGSVSSSITAGTHVTDSGTEADERPPSPESPVFSSSPRRSSDLRQRNISHTGSGGEGYSRLAPAPSGVSPSGGYVSIQSGPRGYVTHPPFWTQSAASKGYVSAGSIPSSNTKTTMYSKVGLKPGPLKSKDGNFSSSRRTSRDHIADSESVMSDDNQFTINPTSSI